MCVYDGIGGVMTTTRNSNERLSTSAGWKALDRLPDGPLDLVGDIHGEIDALRLLLARLGYGEHGTHPTGRRLVFLGDLIDRGPDSPAVVRTVADLVDCGRAVALMGNHDLNAVANLRKQENTWLFGHAEVKEWERPAASEVERREVLSFLRGLPLALEREDLRAVHAYWDEPGLAMLAGEDGPAEALNKHRARILAQWGEGANPVERNLALQNDNPMKLITSGPERRAAQAFFDGGKERQEARHPWWDEYKGEGWLVFGHYWRVPVTGIQNDNGLFSNYPLHSTVGNGNAFCIDYSVGGRWYDRSQGRVSGPYTGRLAALRWPERTLVFDDGEQLQVVAAGKETRA
jgi:hypothetical protein